MALLERKTDGQSGLQVGDEIAFINLGGEMTVTVVRGEGEARGYLPWGDRSQNKKLIYPFTELELQKLASLFCEVAGLHGETKVIRYESTVCVVEVVA